MHKKQMITETATGSFFKKAVLFGMITVLLLECAGCGKKETELFLEETAVQTGEEAVFVKESEEETEETSGFESEQAAGQKESEAVAGSCFVHICGAVREPGVYELPAGSRIFEAVELAGGMTEEACGEYQNQAEKVTDGMKIYIPTEKQLESEADKQAFWKEEEKESEAVQNTANTVNINTADKELLMTLPGVGESRAESILSYREENGSFSKEEDIMKVPGIKEGAYQKLKDKICVD